MRLRQRAHLPISTGAPPVTLSWTPTARSSKPPIVIPSHNPTRSTGGNPMTHPFASYRECPFSHAPCRAHLRLADSVHVGGLFHSICAQRPRRNRPNRRNHRPTSRHQDRIPRLRQARKTSPGKAPASAGSPPPPRTSSALSPAIPSSDEELISVSIQYLAEPNGSRPYDIVYADDTVWFTAMGSNRLGRIDLTYNGSTVIPQPTQYYAMPTANSGPAGIAIAPDGMIWIVSANRPP